MKFVHQWNDILSSEEVLNPQLDSQMEPSTETSTEHPSEPSVESPIQTPVDQSNDPPIELPTSDPIINTSVMTLEQTTEPQNHITELQIQLMDGSSVLSPGMYEKLYDFPKLSSS